MKKRRYQCGQIVLLLSGILLVGFGITIFLYFETVYDWIIKEALKFTPTSATYKAWRTNDPPLIMDIYLFNWTNPEQIRNASVKPEFEEIGPYRFKEVKEKVNITWHENKTISYLVRHYYYFDKENSERDLTDIITTINVIPLAISYKMRYQSQWNRRLVSIGLSTLSSLHVTTTAREILFDGYEEPVLSLLSNLPINVQDKFGLFYGRNGTLENGESSMSFEVDENFGKIVSWNYKNRTDYYPDHCGDIKGSAGEFYPINRHRDKLTLYSSQLCKYAELEYEKDVEIKGIKGYKFTGDHIFDNGTTRPENSCFCAGECIPSGVFNVSGCRDNSPTFLSYPHFYGADPYYTSAINGMKPNRDKHEFYITIEPKSGIIIDIGARMQLNMLLQPVKYIGLYEDVPKVFIPLFYFTQHVGLEDDVAQSLFMIQNLPEYSYYTMLIVTGLGLIYIVGSACLYFWSSKSNSKFKINDEKLSNGNALYQEIPLTEKP